MPKQILFGHFSMKFLLLSRPVWYFHNRTYKLARKMTIRQETQWVLSPWATNLSSIPTCLQCQLKKKLIEKWYVIIDSDLNCPLNWFLKIIHNVEVHMTSILRKNLLLIKWDSNKVMFLNITVNRNRKMIIVH